jgi:hypothetical protein
LTRASSPMTCNLLSKVSDDNLTIRSNARQHAVVAGDFGAAAAEAGPMSSGLATSPCQHRALFS